MVLDMWWNRSDWLCLKKMRKFLVSAPLLLPGYAQVRVDRAPVLWPMSATPCFPPDFVPLAAAAGLTLRLTHMAYRQKEVPKEAQDDGLHEDASGSFWFNPPRPIGWAGWSISRKIESLFFWKKIISRGSSGEYVIFLNSPNSKFEHLNSLK